MTEDQASKIKLSGQKTQVLIKRIWREYLSAHVPKLRLALICMVAAALMSAVFSLMIEPIIDQVFNEGNRSAAVPIAVIIFLIFTLRGLTSYGHTVVINSIGQSIVAKIQTDLFSKFIRQDMAFFYQKNSGELTAHIISDVQVMRGVVAETITAIGRHFLTLVFLIAVMFYQDWKLAIAALLIFPLTAIFVVVVGKRLRKIGGRTQDSVGIMTSFLGETLKGIRQVKAYGQEAYEENRYAQIADKLRALNTKVVRIGNLSTPVNDVLVGLVVGGLIVYGGYQAGAGHMTPGSLMSFITAFLMAYEPMKKLARLNNNLQVGLASSDRVFGMMDQQPMIISPEQSHVATFEEGAIAFQDVDFSYGESDVTLKDISLELPSGSVTALVGPSGAGKTTLLNLIPRFFDPAQGVITVNGVDLKSYDLESLRQKMALVSQDIVIFDASIHDNIAYGNPSATPRQIREAAEQAYAHDFISAMPDGYQTNVGEAGVKLSGGQKQRIAIARAILRNAPILLLDEATSALDSESEAFIQKSLEKLMVGRTTLVIAHRLSTVKDADNIVIMDNGRIVGQGTHSELVKENELYASLVRQNQLN